MAGHMGSQDGKRRSGSQAEVSELWLSWEEWNCGIHIPEGWQGFVGTAGVPLTGGTASLGSLPLGDRLRGRSCCWVPAQITLFGGHWVGPDPSLTASSL